MGGLPCQLHVRTLVLSNVALSPVPSSSLPPVVPLPVTDSGSNLQLCGTSRNIRVTSTHQAKNVGCKEASAVQWSTERVPKMPLRSARLLHGPLRAKQHRLVIYGTLAGGVSAPR